MEDKKVRPNGGLSESQEKKPRHRSPAYPTVSLREAVERVGRLYAADGKAGAPPAIAAKHIGYSKAHGQAHSVLSALKKFGLVADVGGRIVPTQRAIEILRLPEHDPKRIEGLKDAALSPQIYRELVEQHRSTGLPADDVLESDLEVHRNFNPTAVSGFVKDFKETLEYAGLSDLSMLESRSGESEMPKADQIPPKESRTPGDMSPLPPSLVVRKYPLDISIPRSLRAELSIVGNDFRQEDLERLKKQLARLLENLEDAFSS